LVFLKTIAPPIWSGLDWWTGVWDQLG
jgi:hypothetical protein